MKITRAMRMMRAIKILTDLGGGGLGISAGEAGKWSSIPYSTSHRYMSQLLKLRLVKRHTTICRNQETYTFTLTKEGYELIGSQKEML